MAKYQVLASYRILCETYIEADSEDEAWKIAYNLDGGEFSMCRGDGFGDWSVEEVNKLKEMQNA
jgi:hypothetical protein